MKKYLIILLLLVVCYPLYAPSKIDTLELQNKELAIQVNEQSKKIEQLNEQFSYLFNRQNNLNDTAGKVIDWTAMLIGLVTIVLIFAGWVAHNKFSQIEEVKKELENLLRGFKEQLNVLKEQLSTEQRSILELKNDFEKEKNDSIKSLFPIIEGQWYSYQGDSETAIERFKEVQKIVPEHPIVISKLNKLLIYNGKIDEAIQNLEALIVKFPEDVKLRYILAEAYRRNGQLDIAENVIKEFALKTNHATSLYEYGSIKLLKREFSEAEQVLIKSNRSYTTGGGKPKVWVLTNLALAQLLQNKVALSKINIKKSIEILKERIQRTPKNSFFWGSLGLSTAIEQENLHEAHIIFKKAISLGMEIPLARSYKERLELILEVKGENKNIRQIVDTLDQHIEEDKSKELEIE